MANEISESKSRMISLQSSTNNSWNVTAFHWIWVFTLQDLQLYIVLFCAFLYNFIIVRYGRHVIRMSLLALESHWIFNQKHLSGFMVCCFALLSCMQCRCNDSMLCRISIHMHTVYASYRFWQTVYACHTSWYIENKLSFQWTFHVCCNCSEQFARPIWDEDYSVVCFCSCWIV